MRYKELFTIYPRKLKTVTVYYYQCYDSGGKRICGHSTGQRTKTAAKLYCMELFRKGKLIPSDKPVIFEEFAKGWFDINTCKYLEWRQMQNPLALSTIDHYKTALDIQIKPYFGKMKISSITPEIVQKWILKLSHDGYNNSSINMKMATLKVMMKEAFRLKLIPTNPMDKIKKLKFDNKEVKILKNDEVQKLFPSDWKEIWNSYEVYLINKLAAFTGMRLSEIIGLQGEHVHEDHIHVCVQYSKKYKIMPLKTKDSRNIPITTALYSELSVLINKHGSGFLFTKYAGIVPITPNRIYRETKKAFDRIGINSEERKKRGLVLHHWRHFLNTALLMANVNTLKVQKVTGHKTMSMTKHYAHFDSRDFTEVLDVQNNLIAESNNSAVISAVT
ncbi:MAG: site-specific integrase [Treponema sp.]|nr:site-specific integrase [Treponema sp.]MCL2271729.1 site-specific integrase [Treponema sp.]